MKWLTTLVLTTVTASSSIGGSAVTEGRMPSGVITSAQHITASILKPGALKKRTFLEIQQARYRTLLANTTKMNKALKAVKRQAGKTWYVFSGSTPNGWDCSGLVLWTYKKLGIELYHSATKQAHSGKYTTKPVPGDLVAFSYDGKNQFFHIGIYLGKGKMIHAYKPGTKTEIASVNSLGKNVKIRFIRIVDQLQSAA